MSVEYIDGRSYTYKKNNKVEIKVIYNKRQVCNALVALRLSIRNTGKEDISKSNNVMLDFMSLKTAPASALGKLIEKGTFSYYYRIKYILGFTIKFVFLFAKD